MNQRAPWCICHQSSFINNLSNLTTCFRQLKEFIPVKSELSSTAGSNLPAKVMYESTCAVVHLSSIIFHQSSFKSDNLLSLFSFYLTYYLQTAERVYSCGRMMFMKVILIVFLLVVGSFTVNSVNMKKISCSEILKCSVKNAYNSITKIQIGRAHV